SSSPSGDAAHAPPRAVSAGHLCCLGLAENWRSYFSQLRSWEAFCVSAGRPLDLQLTVTCSAATSRTTPGKHRLRSFSSLRSYVHAVSFLHQATGAPSQRKTSCSWPSAEPNVDFLSARGPACRLHLAAGSWPFQRPTSSGRCRMSSFCHLFEESPLCTRWSHLHLSPARVESLAGDAALWLRRGGELSARQFISCLCACLAACDIPAAGFSGQSIRRGGGSFCHQIGFPIESELSEQLHSALEQSGFTESRAALQSAAADALQQIIRSGPNNDDLIFVVGSYSEGWGNSLTTLDGRTDANSDIDVMQLIPGREYHQRGLCECDGAPEQQELVNGHIQCLGFALDNVSACRLCRYPPIAPLLPNRVSNIPHPVLEALRKVLTSASLPCHVVHAASPDRQGEELRVSTSFLENRMLRSLSTLQGQLFVTLKYLVKKVICHKNGFNQQGLKSYHVKTITFRMVDETPVEQWKKENLVSLTRQSLQMLLDCVEKSREQDRQTPDTPDRSRGRIMNHFFLSDVAIYLKGADKERADQHLDGIMSTLRTVIDRLPQLLQQFIGSLRPVSDSGTFYFHPFQIRPNMSPLPLTKSSALEYYQIYDVESLTELIARLPDCALSAREALRALACLKFGDRGTAERVVSSCSSHSVSRGIAWSREKSATEATEEFVMRHLRSRDSAWKFCFRLDQRPKLEFLAGALRACFPLRLSGSNYFYMNFDALLWALRLELRTDREARAQDWIRDVAEREDSDEQELQVAVFYSSNPEQFLICCESLLCHAFAGCWLGPQTSASLLSFLGIEAGWSGAGLLGWLRSGRVEVAAFSAPSLPSSVDIVIAHIQFALPLKSHADFHRHIPFGVPQLRQQLVTAFAFYIGKLAEPNRQAEAWGRSGWSAGPSCSVIFRWEETGSSSRPKELDEPWDAVGLADLVNGRVRPEVASEEAVPGEVAMAGKGHDKGSNILPILVQKDVSEPVRRARNRGTRLPAVLGARPSVPVEGVSPVVDLTIDDCQGHRDQGGRAEERARAAPLGEGVCQLVPRKPCVPWDPLQPDSIASGQEVELPGAVGDCPGVRCGVAKGLARADGKDFVLEDCGESTSVLGMRGNYAAVDDDADPKAGATVFDGSVRVAMDLLEIPVTAGSLSRFPADKDVQRRNVEEGVEAIAFKGQDASKAAVSVSVKTVAHSSASRHDVIVDGWPGDRWNSFRASPKVSQSVFLAFRLHMSLLDRSDLSHALSVLLAKMQALGGWLASRGGVLRLTSESPGFLDEDEPRLVELGVTHKVDRGCDAVLQINLQAMDSLVADHYHAVGESLSRSSSSFSVVGDPQTSMGVSASSAVRVAVESSADVSPAWTLPSPPLRASVLSLPVPSASSVRSMRVAPASWFLAWSSARWIRPDLRVLLAGLRLRFPVSAARTALPGIGSAVCLGFFAGGAWAPVPVSEALAFLASSAFRSSQRRMTRKRWVFCRSPSLAKTSLPSFLGQFSFGRSSRRLRLLSSELHQMKMQPSVLADLTTLTGRPARSWSMSAASMVRQALSSSSAVRSCSSPKTMTAGSPSAGGRPAVPRSRRRRSLRRWLRVRRASAEGPVARAGMSPAEPAASPSAPGGAALVPESPAGVAGAPASAGLKEADDAIAESGKE
uniref:Mab-21 domain-containing protein n=2 Tax=Macrostomum lignano TaxID=282301 RepID=A0A1I8HZW1_9PLAT